MTENSTIEKRLARLERANKILTTTIFLVLAFGVMWTTFRSQDLRVSSLQLVDEQGRSIAELAVRDQQVGLYIMDSEGKTRAALFHAADATGLYVNDKDEVTRVGIAQFAHGGGGVALHGPESKGAAVLYFKESGSLRFFDENGKVTNSLIASSK